MQHHVVRMFGQPLDASMQLKQDADNVINETAAGTTDITAYLHVVRTIYNIRQ